jgi:hypothetical protein
MTANSEKVLRTIRREDGMTRIETRFALLRSRRKKEEKETEEISASLSSKRVA